MKPEIVHLHRAPRDAVLLVLGLTMSRLVYPILTGWLVLTMRILDQTSAPWWSLCHICFPRLPLGPLWSASNASNRIRGLLHLLVFAINGTSGGQGRQPLCFLILNTVTPPHSDGRGAGGKLGEWNEGGRFNKPREHDPGLHCSQFSRSPVLPSWCDWLSHVDLYPF